MLSAATSPIVTIGERRAKAWNDNQQRAVFYASLGLMLASITSISWACTLIGFPKAAAWLVAVSFELLVAIIGDAASSNRRPNQDGTKGGYYGSLWAIFAFMLLLAMTANVGHAVFVMGDAFDSGRMPPFLAHYQTEVMLAGAAFAAAVPLGGTFGFHVSGFLRKYGAGSDWVDEDGAKAHVDSTVAHLRPRPPRKSAAAPAASPRTVITASVPPQPVAPQQGTFVTAPVPLQPAAPQPQAVAPQQGTGPAPAGAGNRTDLTEEEVYGLIKEALDRGEDERLQAKGDLNGVGISELIGAHESTGRRMRHRCLSRYVAETNQQHVPEWVRQLAEAS
ncbi:hypothetical protein [Streptomyces sp. MBT27]|uniref:hypothetical protein n=1 Tax=Streptomyces sp. MBT27 TaxID=1488356 RepID=UPI0014234A28|nr:hypothetical protein [Streptomyces sp. MBT27]